MYCITIEKDRYRSQINYYRKINQNGVEKFQLIAVFFNSDMIYFNKKYEKDRTYLMSISRDIVKDLNIENLKIPLFNVTSPDIGLRDFILNVERISVFANDLASPNIWMSTIQTIGLSLGLEYLTYQSGWPIMEPIPEHIKLAERILVENSNIVI